MEVKLWFIGSVVELTIIAGVYSIVQYNRKGSRKLREKEKIKNLHRTIKNVRSNILSVVNRLKNDMDEYIEDSEIYTFTKVRYDRLLKVISLLDILDVEVRLKIDTESLSELNDAFKNFNINYQLGESINTDELQKSFDCILSMDELSPNSTMQELIKKYS